MKDTKDLIIIGGSAAGVTAAIYAARRKLDFLIVSGDIGGEVALSGEVENYPAILKTDGIELAQKYKEQLDYYEVERELDSWVFSVVKKDNIVVVKAKKSGEEKEYKAKTVIIATGVKPRYLEIPGEKELYHKGVSYCTVCDGPLFKNKITATIGTGNSAIESSLMMASIAKKHYVLLKYDDFKGDAIIADKLKSLPNVEILRKTNTTKILGEKFVTGIEYEQNGETKTLEVNGVFAHIGMTPHTDFIDIVLKVKNGFIVIDKLCKTNVNGIFAAGDVTDIPYNQIVIASGHGATAALSAIDYINKM